MMDGKKGIRTDPAVVHIVYIYILIIEVTDQLASKSL